MRGDEPTLFIDEWLLLLNVRERWGQGDLAHPVSFFVRFCGDSDGDRSVCGGDDEGNDTDMVAEVAVWELLAGKFSLPL